MLRLVVHTIAVDAFEIPVGTRLGRAGSGVILDLETQSVTSVMT